MIKASCQRIRNYFCRSANSNYYLNFISMSRASRKSARVSASTVKRGRVCFRTAVAKGMRVNRDDMPGDNGATSFTPSPRFRSQLPGHAANRDTLYRETLNGGGQTPFRDTLRVAGLEGLYASLILWPVFIVGACPCITNGVSAGRLDGGTHLAVFDLSSAKWRRTQPD